MSVYVGWKYQNRKSQPSLVFMIDESVVPIFLSTAVREREDLATHTRGGTRTWESPSNISAKNSALASFRDGMHGRSWRPKLCGKRRSRPCCRLSGTIGRRGKLSLKYAKITRMQDSGCATGDPFTRLLPAIGLRC